MVEQEPVGTVTSITIGGENELPITRRTRSGHPELSASAHVEGLGKLMILFTYRGPDSVKPDFVTGMIELTPNSPPVELNFRGSMEYHPGHTHNFLPNPGDPTTESVSPGGRSLLFSLDEKKSCSEGLPHRPNPATFRIQITRAPVEVQAAT